MCRWAGSLDKAERGIAAQHLLDNELLNACWDALEAHYIKAWKDSRSVEAREDAHRYVSLITHLKQDLRSIATTGELETKRLEALSGKSASKWRII